MTKSTPPNPKIRPPIDITTLRQSPVESPLIQLLNTAEILRVLDEFSLQHVPQLYNGAEGMLEGLTDTQRRVIVLTQDNTKYARYTTILHELIHASDIIRTGSTNENYTKQRERQNFKNIFGWDYKG